MTFSAVALERRRGLLLVAICLFLCSPALAEGSLKSRTEGTYLRKLADRGTIRIGMQKNVAPFHIPGNQEYPGYDVELGKAIAHHMGLKPEFIFGELEELLKMAEKGEIDVAIGGISTNPKRALSVNFTVPYIKTTPAALLSRKSLPPETGSIDFPKRKFESLLDLRFAGALKIAVHEGTTNEEILRTDPEFSLHTIQSYSDNDAALDALDAGEVDAFVADGVFIQAQTIIRQELLSRYVPLLSVYREEHLSLVLPSGDSEYWMYMNFLVKEMHRTGELQRIYDRYFSNSEWARNTVVE